MTTKYNYAAFKTHLTTNPKWIARGLQVLHAKDVDVELLVDDAVRLNYMVNQLAFAKDKKLPWTLDSEYGKEAVKFVTRYAPGIYRFYVRERTTP